MKRNIVLSIALIVGMAGCGNDIGDGVKKESASSSSKKEKTSVAESNSSTSKVMAVSDTKDSVSPALKEKANVMPSDDTEAGKEMDMEATVSESSAVKSMESDDTDAGKQVDSEPNASFSSEDVMMESDDTDAGKVFDEEPN